MMRQEFARQLDALHDELREMGELCQTAIGSALGVLLEGNAGEAAHTAELEARIDAAQRDIERRCMRLLLLQQPIAGDLSKVACAMKMIVDLERIGDQAADIADIVAADQVSPEDVTDEIAEMCRLTCDMVSWSLKAYENGDMELVERVLRTDDQVDALFDRAKERLVLCLRQAENDAAQAIDLMMIAKYLERIGDHAENLAQAVQSMGHGVLN